MTTNHESGQQLAVAKKLEVEIGYNGLELRNMDDMRKFCLAVVNSGLAPKEYRTPEAVLVAVQCGLELGLRPMQSLWSIAVINGRPTLWGDAALALVKAHRDFVDIDELPSEDVATCTLVRRGQKPIVRTFSVSDAKRAGLWGKSGPWTTYPQRMLQMRARSWALRDGFPDALRGIQIREEVQDYQPIKNARGREAASGLVLPGEPKTELLEEVAA